jgi:ATP-dependent Clp protease protease subunit
MPAWRSTTRCSSSSPRSRREAIALKRRIEGIIAEHTSQPLEQVSKDMERDYFMTAEEAKDYGIIDTVIANRTGAG